MRIVPHWRTPSPCRTRAYRYRRLDSTLNEHTRFFGAAALISETLHTVLHTGVRLTVGATTRAFLAALGCELETRNMMLAREIERGRLGGPKLDAYIVFLEQSWVEERLLGLRATAPHEHACVVRGVDELLTWCGWRIPHLQPSSRLLHRVVSGLSLERRRPLKFARQQDREALGNGIIQELKAARQWRAPRPETAATLAESAESDESAEAADRRGAMPHRSLNPARPSSAPSEPGKRYDLPFIPSCDATA